MIRKLTLALFLVAAVAVADYYSMTVTRVDQDLYKDQDSGVYIKTRYCYVYAYWEEAILKYEPYAYDNRLIFTESDETCDVEKVFK